MKLAKKNPVIQDLYSKKYKNRIVKPKKGKGKTQVQLGNIKETLGRLGEHQRNLRCYWIAVDVLEMFLDFCLPRYCPMCCQI